MTGASSPAESSRAVPLLWAAVCHNTVRSAGRSSSCRSFGLSLRARSRCGGTRVQDRKVVFAVVMVLQVGIRGDDRHLVACPMHHSMAPAFGMLLAIGATVVLRARWRARHHRARAGDLLLIVPTMLVRLAALPGGASAAPGPPVLIFLRRWLSVAAHSGKATCATARSTPSPA